MTAVRILGEADLAAAVPVVAHGIAEIPLYRWLLGDEADDAAERDWLARFLLTPLLRAGCVAGAEVDGAMVGVIAWQPHDLGADGSTALTADGFGLADRPAEILRRLRELAVRPPLPPPVEDAVYIVVVAALPGVRGGDVLLRLAAPIEEYCRERNRPGYVWTGTSRLREWFLHGWQGDQFAEIEWNGVPVYGLVSGRPPVSKWR